MSFRKTLFWLHLSMGIAAGSVILIMSVTGVVLAFQRQIVAGVDRWYMGSFTLPLEPHHVSADAISAEAMQATGTRPTALTFPRDQSSPVKVDLGEQRSIYLNPYTGAVLGEGSQRVRRFFRTNVELHRWLAAGASWRDTGKAITGAGNLMFLLLVCSGLYLWMPRRWSWRAVRRAALFRNDLGGRARFWNWHNVFGIWCAMPLLLITLSGVVMSYRWATDAVYRLTGNQPPAPQQRSGKASARPQERGQRRDAQLQMATDAEASLDVLLANAQKQVPDWQSITLQVAPEAPALSAVVLTGAEGRPDKRVQLSFDRSTGEVTKVQSFATYNAGRRLRAWLRFIHTGEAGGLAGQVVAAIASFGGAALMLTGIILAVRRLQRYRARHSESAAVQPVEMNVA